MQPAQRAALARHGVESSTDELRYQYELGVLSYVVGQRSREMVISRISEVPS